MASKELLRSLDILDPSNNHFPKGCLWRSRSEIHVFL